MVTTTARVNERWVGDGEVEVSGAAFDGGQDMSGLMTIAAAANAETSTGTESHRRRTVTQSQLLSA
jgi:hypothetical protein